VAATTCNLSKEMFTLKMYVANVCFKCFRCFRYILQMFHIDVVKVDWDVTYVASVLEVCCKCLFKIFHLFQTYVASALYGYCIC
jgi:hypothetical protein